MKTRRAGKVAVCMVAIMTTGLSSLAQAPAVLSQSVEPTTSLKQIRVELRLDGLYPKLITVEPGEYQILFVNATYPVALTLAIVDGNNKGNGVVVSTANSAKVEHKKQMKVKLTPGRHTVQVLGQPNWTSEIQVTAKGN